MNIPQTEPILSQEETSQCPKWKVLLKTFISNFVLFTLVYTLVMLFLYGMIIIVPEKIFGYTLSIPAIFYILFTASSIILTTWGEEISQVIRQVFVGNRRKTVYSKTLNERKIRVILIFIYFIAIIVFTLSTLTAQPVFSIEQMDYAVIQSFATYIAYDRLIRNVPTIA